MAQLKTPSRSDWPAFAVYSAAVYLFLQSFTVVAHEFAHSTTAWLLGYTATPFTVLWGNPLTLKGWDEGVPYDQLFHRSGIHAEAAIGGMPLLMHVGFTLIGLFLLLRPNVRKRVPLQLAYWFVIVNLTELVAYILMRPFIPTGDTGRFNEGFGISPWPLFLAGSVFLVAVWVLIFTRVLPKLDLGWNGDAAKHRVIVSLTAFFMFLWGSGLRFISLYPDRLWRWGLIGLAGFLAWTLVDLYRNRTEPGYLRSRF